MLYLPRFCGTAQLAAPSPWVEHIGKLIAAGVAIQTSAKVDLGPDGAGDIKVLACTLLSRTLLNARGVLILASAGLVVEARVLTRCCFENQFWIAGLAAEGDAFAQEMFHDEIKSRQLRGQFLFQADPRRENVESESAKRLREWLRDAKQNWPTASMLSPKAVASKGPVQAGYVFYGQLSSDAAHPSLDALNRHIVTHEESGEQIRGIDLFPEARPEQIEDTLNLAACALIGACIGTNEILGFPSGGEVLNSLVEEYKALEIAGRQSWRST